MQLRHLFVSAALLLAAREAQAQEERLRIGGTAGLQFSERSAWVFGPSLEVRLRPELYLRGEGQLEFGDIDAPFGPSNIFSGPGPHVNHVLVGPIYRPARYAPYNVAGGLQFGIQILHSIFVPAEEFTIDPGAGAFVQAGHRTGPLDLALQLRLDLAGDVKDAGPNGETVRATVFRAVLSFEVPLLF